MARVSWISQTFLSFFYPQGTRKKTVKVSGSKKKNKRTAKSNQAFQVNTVEKVIEDGMNAMHFTPAEHEFLNDELDAAAEADVPLPDDAKTAHDTTAVKGISAQAHHEAKEVYGISIPPREELDAATLMVKVSDIVTWNLGY